MNKQTLPYLCDTFLYSESKGIQKIMAKEYLSKKLGYPDKNSDFDNKFGKLKYLFRGHKTNKTNKIITGFGLWYLKKQGYDALMLDLIEDPHNDLAKGIIGHAAFQIHKDNSLHIFSVEVLPQYRQKNFSKYMVERVLEEARKREMKRTRIGKGTHESANHVYQNFAKRAEELKILPHKGNWIEILY